MPLRFLCEGCGYVLYEGSGFKIDPRKRRHLDLIGPDNISKKYGGKCPKCKKELNIPAFNISISPLDNQKIGPTPYVKKKNI